MLNVYFVKKYEKQFLDEITTNGIQVHYRNGTKEKFDNRDYRYTSVAVTSKLTPDELVEKICSW